MLLQIRRHYISPSISEIYVIRVLGMGKTQFIQIEIETFKELYNRQEAEKVGACSLNPIVSSLARKFEFYHHRIFKMLSSSDTAITLCQPPYPGFPAALKTVHAQLRSFLLLKTRWSNEQKLTPAS